MAKTSESSKQRGRAVSLWLADEDIAQLKRIAHEKGIGHTTLMRMWIRERLTELNTPKRREGD